MRKNKKTKLISFNFKFNMISLFFELFCLDSLDMEKVIYSTDVSKVSFICSCIMIPFK